MTRGFSVVVTSLAGVGGRSSPPPPAARCCCCATAIVVRARADPRKQQAIAQVAFKFIRPPNGLAASQVKPEFAFASGRRQYIPEHFANGRGVEGQKVKGGRGWCYLTEKNPAAQNRRF